MRSKAATKRAGGICVLLLALVVLIVGNGVASANLPTDVVDTEVLTTATIPPSAGTVSSGTGSLWSLPPRYSEPQFILRVRDAGSYESTLTSGDFNGDGLDDVITARTAPETTQTFELDILLNDGNGSLILSTSSMFLGTIPQVQQPAPIRLIADFNGDETPDLFVPDRGTNAAPHPGHQNTLVLSAPGGKLVDATANLPQLSDVTFSATTGDIDGDGDIDLYLGNIWGMTMIDPQILLNDGSGRFTVAGNRLPPSLSLTQNGYMASEFVDVNNDGFPELVLGDAGDTIDNTLSTDDSVVLLNDGLGFFSLLPQPLPPMPFGDEALATDIQPVDLNHDGYQDLCIAYGVVCAEGRYIQVLINNQDNTFRDETDTRLPQSEGMIYGGERYYQLELRDIDYDRDLDLIARPWDDQAPNPLLFLNDGDGYFSWQSLDFGTESLYYTFLDLDGDSGHDLLFSTYTPPEDIYAIRHLGGPVFLPLVCSSYSAGH